jgi:serine/threonine protein kinase
MIAGNTPFYEEGMDQITLFRAIVRGSFEFPKSGSMSAEADDSIMRLLVVDPSQRLGSLASGLKDIYRQSWFRDMNFDRLKRKEIRAPWVPKISDPLDTANFENWDHLPDKTRPFIHSFLPKKISSLACFKFHFKFNLMPRIAIVSGVMCEGTSLLGFLGGLFERIQLWKKEQSEKVL